MKAVIIVALSALTGLFVYFKFINEPNVRADERAKVIAEIKVAPVKVETTYIKIKAPPTKDKKPALPIHTPDFDSLNAAWALIDANKDSLLRYFTQSIRVSFEDSLQYHFVTCEPLYRMIELESIPKLDSIPVINTSQTYVEPPPPYQKLQWWNPTIHGDFFPFTPEGILAGASFSLCSIGSNPSSNGMIFYFPTIGLATDTKEKVIAHAGIRWNFAHHLPLISDTHLIIVVTSEKKIIVGVGTSL